METQQRLLCAAVLAAGLAAGAVAQEAGPQDPRPGTQGPAYVGRAFVFQADLEAGRRLGWLDPEVSEPEAIDRKSVV